MLDRETVLLAIGLGWPVAVFVLGLDAMPVVFATVGTDGLQRAVAPGSLPDE